MFCSITSQHVTSCYSFFGLFNFDNLSFLHFVIGGRYFSVRGSLVIVANLLYLIPRSPNFCFQFVSWLHENISYDHEIHNLSAVECHLKIQIKIISVTAQLRLLKNIALRDTQFIRLLKWN